MSERTHLAMSAEPIILREALVGLYDGVGAYKPAGFWYEVDGDWRRWCEAEDFGYGSHLHSVSLNNCNVLLIDSLGKLDDFHGEYNIAKPISLTYLHLTIDWPKVAALYDGIEIAPYRWERRLTHDFMWYYGWDCASGVIWRPKNAVVAYVGEVKPDSHEQTELLGSGPIPSGQSSE
jgi:hypothetical protein